MYKDGLHTLQPTVPLLKQAPSATATMNTAAFPAEISLTLRHVPQPEHFAKSGRSNGSTYIAYLINNSLDTKTFLGTFEKLRSGTFQLIAGDIPCGSWDQLVISLGAADTTTLGLPLFTLSYSFSNPAPQERFSALPADFGSEAIRQTPAKPPDPEPQKQYREEPTPAPTAQKPFLPKAEAPQTPSAVPEGGSEDMLLQPGIPLPEDNITAIGPDVTVPRGAKSETPTEPSRESPQLTDQTLYPLEIAELPNHKLWLINYEGRQLVGYVYDPANPRKPQFIVHGLPGANNRQAKPQDQGYDYWIADPNGKEGFWLRYVSPYDNLIAHPYPVK